MIRAVEGPLANIQDAAPEATHYPGPAEHLRDVWVAVRANLRAVLESVTLADLTAGKLPREVEAPDRRSGRLGSPLTASISAPRSTSLPSAAR